MKANSKFCAISLAASLLLALSSLGGCASLGQKGSGTVWDVDLHHSKVRIGERTYAVTSETKLTDADGYPITLREIRSSSSPDVGLRLDRAQVEYRASPNETGTWVLHSLHPTHP